MRCTLGQLWYGIVQTKCRPAWLNMEQSGNWNGRHFSFHPKSNHTVRENYKPFRSQGILKKFGGTTNSFPVYCFMAPAAGFHTSSKMCWRSWIPKNLFFQRYIQDWDPEFTEANFVHQASEQFEIVSSHLSKRELEPLLDIVERHEIDRIKRRYNFLNETDVKWLKIDHKDITDLRVHNLLTLDGPLFFKNGPHGTYLEVKVSFQGFHTIHENPNLAPQERVMNFFVCKYVFRKQILPIDYFDDKKPWTIAGIRHSRNGITTVL